MLIHNSMKKDYKIVRISIWIICCFLGYFAFYYPHSYDEIGQKPSKFIQIVFFLFIFKYFISFFYFWTFYSLSFGYSRYLKAIMNFKWYIPWSRLSLSISLIQFIYLHYSLASTRTIFVFNRLFVLKEIISTFAFTWWCGNLVYLLFEQPSNNLFKNYFGAKRRQDVKIKNKEDDKDDKDDKDNKLKKN